MTGAAVVVGGLRVGLTGSSLAIVEEIDFEIAAGEVLGLVGESGSGKTTVGLALLGHCRRGAEITAGRIMIGDIEILRADPAALRAARGRIVAYVPQDPGTALNPALRVGEQLEEMLAAHLPEMNAAARRARLLEMLEEVRLPATAALLRRFAHQFSGGQQQRLALAMAFACRPRLIVLDEPTTGLDVSTQAHVLRTVRELCRAHGVAALYVSHDLAVVAELAHRVVVMYAGRIVEQGAGRDVFTAARHPYTERLLRAIPDPARRRSVVGIPGHAPSVARRPSGCAFAPRCDRATELCRQTFPPVTTLPNGQRLRCWHAGDGAAHGLSEKGEEATLEVGPALLSMRGLDASYGDFTVLQAVELEVRTGECLALVGESGSGKTTLARCIAGLHHHYTQPVVFRGRPLGRAVGERDQDARRRIQYVFQNPYASLNPRRTVGEAIARPLRLFFDLGRDSLARRVAGALEKVSLPAALAGRYPDQLSGGERQRVAIARALAAEPDLLVCDEITSALDVSVQAAIMELLAGLRGSTGLSLLFVTHNLALIRTIADRVAVMSAGRIVEIGATEAIFGTPQADYTRELLTNTPGLPTAA
jgi:peptide/nickel transport system ATP-binding protein